MILGIGSDICMISRVETLLTHYGRRFEERVFSDAERDKAQKADSIGQRAAIYAKRFAAKEAFVKAIGSGFGHGIYYRDIAVVNDTSGKPSLSLSAVAERAVQHITPTGRQSHIHVSLSDDGPYALAFVVIEAV